MVSVVQKSDHGFVAVVFNDIDSCVFLFHAPDVSEAYVQDSAQNRADGTAVGNYYYRLARVVLDDF
jgi:hypothetical protein